MLKKLLLTAMCVSVCYIVSAQVTIKGRVLNAETGEPVVGANIRVDHSLQGGTTNAKGEFVIKGLPDGKQTLQCRISIMSRSGILLQRVWITW